MGYPSRLKSRRRRERDYVSRVHLISYPTNSILGLFIMYALTLMIILIHTPHPKYTPSEKRLKIGNILKIIFGAQEAPILGVF